MRWIRFVTVFSITLAILAMPALTFSEPEISSVTEVLKFRSFEAGTAEPLTASLKGAERFTVAWRLQEAAPEGLFIADDSTVYYWTGRQLRAVLPSGERIGLGKLSQGQIEVPPRAPAGVAAEERAVTKQGSNGKLWSYILSGERRVLPETLQSDALGNVYFQDDAQSWYSLDESGRERYVLELNGQDEKAVCRAAPSGDAICASRLLGLIGIREKTNAPRLIIDGKERFFPQRPKLLDGVTFVPFRSIFEAMQADVTWNEKGRQTVEAMKGKRTVRLTLGSKEAFINGKKVRLDHPLVVRNGTTLVPLRFVGEALGETVIWEGATRTIQIAAR